MNETFLQQWMNGIALGNSYQHSKQFYKKNY